MKNAKLKIKNGDWPGGAPVFAPEAGALPIFSKKSALIIGLYGRDLRNEDESEDDEDDYYECHYPKN